MCVRQFQLHPHIKEWNNLNIACSEKGKVSKTHESETNHDDTDSTLQVENLRQKVK